jgi:hypothetical protein
MEMVIAERDKVCETCRYYDPEFYFDCGVCLKDKKYPVPMEEWETCDDWEAEDDELTEAEEKSVLGDLEYQKFKEEDE